MRLRNLADVFPYGSCTTATMDLDHTKPYLPMNRGGPPGQYLFRYHYLVTNQGTLPLGQTAFAQAIWRAATDES